MAHRSIAQQIRIYEDDFTNRANGLPISLSNPTIITSSPSFHFNSESVYISVLNLAQDAHTSPTGEITPMRRIKIEGTQYTTEELASLWFRLGIVLISSDLPHVCHQARLGELVNGELSLAAPKPLKL